MRIIQSAHPRPLNLLAVGQGGLVAAASDTLEAGGVEAWDAGSGAPRWAILSPRVGFRCLAFMLGGAYFFAADAGEELLFALPPTGGPPGGHFRTVTPFASVGAAGDRVYVGRSGSVPELVGLAGARMNLLWRRDNQNDFRDPHTEFGPSIAVNRVGHPAVSVREGATHPKQTISVRDAGTGAPRASIPFDPAGPVRQLAFTADGAKLVVRTDSRTVHLFNANTGVAAGELVHPGRAYVTAVAAHPGGLVACARTDGTVTFWDAEKRERVRTLDWKAGKLVSLAFAPDGALAAAGTEDGKVVVWDVDP